MEGRFLTVNQSSRSLGVLGPQRILIFTRNHFEPQTEILSSCGGKAYTSYNACVVKVSLVDNDYLKVYYGMDVKQKLKLL